MGATGGDGLTSTQPLIAGGGGFARRFFFGFRLARWVGYHHHASPRNLMAGVDRHSVEEVRGDSRYDRDHQEARREIRSTEFADVTQHHAGFHRERANRDSGRDRELLVDAD